MAPEQSIRMIRSQDLTFRAKMSPPVDMTGWAISFTMRDALAGTIKITKTVGAGITITDGPKGIITIAIDKADTSALSVTTSLADLKGYVWDITRTDAGFRLVLARGELILEQEVCA